MNLNTEGEVIRKLYIGDVRETLLQKDILDCDLFFLDSDHSYDFAIWICENVFPYLKHDIIIMIHDWPGYDNDGNPGNTLVGLCDDVIQKSLNGEPMAIKELFLNKNLGKSIINTTDYMLEQGEEYSNDIIQIAGCTQILIKL